MSISQNFPDEGPTLNLNFAGSKVLDPRITFSRSSVGTYMDANGLVATASADSPRFDHRYVNGEVESLGLLVEEQRVNLVNDSNGGDYGYAMSSGPSPTNDIAPDGSIVACKYDLSSINTGSPFLNVGADTTLTDGVTYTMSMWVKGTTEFTVALAFVGETNNTVPNRNMNVTTSWTRETFTFTLSGNQSYSRLQVFFGTQGQGKIISIWGAQLEEGGFATSYIPRSAGSQATRTEDRAVIEGTNFTDIFDTSFESFSMFVNYDNLGITTGTNHAVVIFWGESVGYNDRIEFYKDNDDPYHIETRAFGGGSGVFANGNLSAGSTAATQKLAMSWSVPDYSDQPSRRWAFSFNGESVDVVNDGSGSTIPAVTRVGFGINPTRTDFHGKRITFKQITLYSNALTDSQLQNLTK